MTVLTPTDRGIKDFTEHIDVQFRIDDDIFVGMSNIPALHLMQFGSMFDGMTPEQIVNNPETYHDMMSLVLEQSSADLFFARMGDKTKPISLPQMMNVVTWLMEEYGMRPTPPSPASSSGSANPGDGTSSTGSQSPLGLTSSNFPPLAS